MHPTPQRAPLTGTIHPEQEQPQPEEHPLAKTENLDKGEGHWTICYPDPSWILLPTPGPTAISTRHAAARWDLLVAFSSCCSPRLWHLQICRNVAIAEEEVLKEGNIFVGMRCIWKPRSNLGFWWSSSVPGEVVLRLPRQWPLQHSQVLW